MSVRARLRRARWVTLGIWLFQTLLAASLALPLLAIEQPPAPAVRVGVADWIALLRLGTNAAESGPGLALLPLSASALSAPWLCLVWLLALERSGSFADHARLACARWRSSYLLALYGLACLVALSFAATRCAGWLAAALALDDRGHDLLLLGCAAAWGCGVCAVLTVLELAFVGISRGLAGPRLALRAALARNGWSIARRVGVRMLLGALQLALFALATLLPRAWLGAGIATAACVFSTTHAASLVSTCVRAAWLAWLLETTDAPQPT